MPDGSRKSLWADPDDGWAEREPDVVARVLDDEPEPPAPVPPPRPRPPARPLRPGAVAAGLLAGLVIVALTASLAGRGSLTVEEVPSSWDGVPMTCETTRFDQSEGAIELFRCRAVAGGALPPGVYRSPESRWSSDLTRREARANAMVISPEGELGGWAVYGR